MISRYEYEQIKKESTDILKKAGIVVRPDEIDTMEVADFGLSEIRVSGVQIINLVDTEQIGTKLLMMLPYQATPEHTHPAVGDYAGKEEIIRCEFGDLYVYGPGESETNPSGKPPEHRRQHYTVWHEYILKPGDQVRFEPGTPHWFQGGAEGAVAWSFSTKVVNAEDQFTDPQVERASVIED